MGGASRVANFGLPTYTGFQPPIATPEDIATAEKFRAETAAGSGEKDVADHRSLQQLYADIQRQWGEAGLDPASFISLSSTLNPCAAPPPPRKEPPTMDQTEILNEKLIEQKLLLKKTRRRVTFLTAATLLLLGVNRGEIAESLRWLVRLGAQLLEQAAS